MKYDEALGSLPAEIREALARAAARAGFAEDDPLYGLLVAQAVLLSSAAPVAQAATELRNVFGEFNRQAHQLTMRQTSALQEIDQRIAALETSVVKVATVADNAERVSAKALLFSLFVAFAFGVVISPLITRFLPF